MTQLQGVEFDHAGFVARFGPRSADYLTLMGSVLLATLLTLTTTSIGVGPGLCLAGLVWLTALASLVPIFTHRELRLSADGLRLTVRRPWFVAHRWFALRRLEVQPYSVDESRFIELRDLGDGSTQHLPFGTSIEEWKWWTRTLRDLCEVARTEPEVSDNPEARRHVMRLLADLQR
jgi:hypothetical protein